MITNSNKYVARLRDRLLNDTILWGAILSIPMVTLSLARIPMMGWRPVFALQIVVVLALWGVWLQRHRVSYYWRLGTIIFLIGSAGLSAYAQHGPAAVAGQLLLLIIVLAVLLTDRKVALGIGLILIAGLLLISWGGISGALPFQIEYQEYARSPVTWALIILAVGGYGGMIAHLVSRLFWDLIEREQQLAEANAELAIRTEEACAATLAKSQFLATMSHEIRTPMNGILGMAQVLQMPGVSEAERLDYARTILGSGQTLLTLLNDILDLSKIEAGKVELEVIALEPEQVIGEAQALFAQTARGKGLRIETDWSGAPRNYLGDPHRVRQMLSNLVGNAVKFTAEGQIRIEAREVEGDGQTALLEFSVSDSGIGITQDDQARLFQAFSQADSSITRSYGGSGLGLSLMANFARLMGGEVGVDSEAGRGSRFWFRIRAGRAAAERPLQATSGGGAHRGMPAQLAGRVLVVEDNPDNRKVVEILLHKLGLDTAVAEDGQQALDALARGEAAELILMDVQMPRLDGYRTTEAIRRREAESGAPRRPIIALTAEAFAEDRQRCLAAGMDDVLTKPVAFDALKEVLGKWLPAAAGATATAADGGEAPVVEQPLDVARVTALVEELLPLLAQNKFNAIGRFKALREAVLGTAMAAEIEEAGHLLEGLNFAATLAHLRQTAAKHGWSKTE